MIIDLLQERIKRQRPQAIDSWIRTSITRQHLTLRTKIHPKLLRPAAQGHVSGLLGVKWITADAKQRQHWVDIAEQAYRELYA